MIYCPHCSGEIRVITCARPFVHCKECAFTSELDTTTGELFDTPQRLRIIDLQEPAFYLGADGITACRNDVAREEGLVNGELKMTVLCVCGNQYGAWRPRCPACGKGIPVTIAEVARKAMNPPRIKHERERRQNECIFCHRGKAKERCPHCNEPVHRNCQGLHGGDCAQFQQARQAEIERVSA